MVCVFLLWPYRSQSLSVCLLVDVVSLENGCFYRLVVTCFSCFHRCEGLLSFFSELGCQLIPPMFLWHLECVHRPLECRVEASMSSISVKLVNFMSCLTMTVSFAGTNFIRACCINFSSYSTSRFLFSWSCISISIISAESAGSDPASVVKTCNLYVTHCFTISLNRH